MTTPANSNEIFSATIFSDSGLNNADHAICVAVPIVRVYGFSGATVDRKQLGKFLQYNVQPDCTR